MDTTIQTANAAAVKKPGRTMPNGGIILDQVLVNESEYGYEYIVLALNIGAVEPFVTWFRCIGIEQKADGSTGPLDYCVWGHYSRNLDDALEEFKNRVEHALTGNA